MCRTLRIILLVIVILAPVLVEAQMEDFNNIEPKENVRWIEETPQRPENYIGQLFLVDKNNKTTPFYANVPVSVSVEEEPSIKKSRLVKSSSDGSVSFLDIFKIIGQKQSVYEFQIVYGKKWSADTKSPDYLKAIAAFRNDPMTSSIFESKDITGVIMVTGVVQKKIWYKVYNRKSRGTNGIYYIKLEGNDYYGSDEYEESIKYGLLLRPIHWSTNPLPKVIVNQKQVIDIYANAVIPGNVQENLVASADTLIFNNRMQKE